MRHALEQQVHGLNVTAANVMLCSTHAQEQQGFCSSMEQNQERGGPNCLGGANARASSDQAQVRDGGIRQNTLSIALGNCHKRAEQEREAAHQDNHGGSRKAYSENRCQLDQQEHARLNHGGRMKQCAGGSGCDHSAQKPGMERHLGRLRQTGKRQADCGNCHQIGVRNAKRQERIERQRVEIHYREVHANQEGNATQQVHDDLAERIADCLFGLGETDKQEGANRGYFPTGEHPQHIVGAYDKEHRRKEDEHQREEVRTAVLCSLGLVMLEVFHITQGVYADARANDANDQRHKDNQRINNKTCGYLDSVSHAQFKSKRADNLDQRQDASEDVFVLDRKAENDNGDNNANTRANRIHNSRAVCD